MISLPQGIVKIANGVFQAQGVCTILSHAYTEFLVNDANTNDRKRSRINFHPSPTSQVQEMVIALNKNTRLEVHRHLDKSESFHIIYGTLMVVLFDNFGNIIDEITLSSSGPTIYYRLDNAIDHLVIPLSNYVLMHETTCGPFVQGDACVPHWSSTTQGQDRIESIRKFHIDKFEPS